MFIDIILYLQNRNFSTVILLKTHFNRKKAIILNYEGEGFVITRGIIRFFK